MKQRVIQGSDNDPLAVQDEANPEADRWKMELMSYTILPTHETAGMTSTPINLLVTQAGADAAAVTHLLNADGTSGRVGEKRGRRASVVIENIVAPHHVSKTDLHSKQYSVSLTVKPGTARHKFTFGSTAVDTDEV